MKKKYEVLFYIDKLSTKKDQNDPSKMVFSRYIKLSGA